jgi:hypothetical protein
MYKDEKIQKEIEKRCGNKYGFLKTKIINSKKYIFLCKKV